MFALLLRAELLARTAASYAGARIRNERGQDLIEYALMGGILAAFIVALGALLGGTILTDMATAIADCLEFDGTC